MIDIHMHIIPGIDDGAADYDDSLRMASMSYESGVHHIVTTSHCYPGYYDNYAGESMDKKWEKLAERIQIERIPVRLYKGMEIMASDRLKDDLINRKVWTINDTDYFLVEFEFDEKPSFCAKILSECKTAGFKPVIAHPERYFFVQNNPGIVYDWYREGYGIQINKGSLLKQFGHKERDTAESLLRHHVVSCVASDAHNYSSRNPSFGRLFSYLRDNFGKEYAYLLTRENPGRILSGRRLVGYEPLEYNKLSRRYGG